LRRKKDGPGAPHEKRGECKKREPFDKIREGVEKNPPTDGGGVDRGRRRTGLGKSENKKNEPNPTPHPGLRVKRGNSLKNQKGKRETKNVQGGWTGRVGEHDRWWLGKCTGISTFYGSGRTN